jgi:hypothetical protein
VADSNGLSEFPKEHIPDEDYLYLRVHRNHQENGELNPSAIRDHGNGMSTCWEKYSTAEEARQRATRHPNDNGVVRMLVRKVREIPGVKVDHSPLPDNRSHTDVVGNKKDQEIRAKLLRACEWVIPIHPPTP